MNELEKVSVVIVPGLRDETPAHWQALLAQELPDVRSTPALGRANLDLDARIEAIEAAVSAATHPVVLVAHSGGCIATVHWASRTRLKLRGALLATPPALRRPLGPEYPSLSAFAQAGWLPMPLQRLPFPCVVGASRNDPLAEFTEAADLALAWGAKLVDLGAVGHLNPASGYGPWPGAHALIRRLALGQVESPVAA